MEDGGTNAKSLDPHLNSEDGSKREDVEEKEESGVEGGLMNNLISTLSPTNIGKSNENESDGDDGERKRVDEGGEGGFISKMVSNFFHQSEGEGVVENEEDKEEEEIKGGERIKRLKTENNGGIIHNIVSHLPAASIPDGAVPTADEATFLINSLVRD
ncbi:uncharacterized protein LOC109791690 isoform X2 [Cajanus cajan]|uniref:Uncharacterized protein n=1 Tax=Cajanus cajan TaxID=3821 RepID=A0A151QXN6_CAJCA|nr:uncharacterized protein LOC109791690 isoform X2 [Cajanus cajan]KYP35019.1 hypothetical protein KK1_043964 [Cajanus cajan]